MNMHMGAIGMAEPATAAQTQIETGPILTTVDPFFVRLAAVEKKRLRLRISRLTLAAAAGVSRNTLDNALAGITQIRASNLRKLERAIDDLGRRSDQRLFMLATYRGLMTALAREAQLEPDTVLKADPRHERGPVARARMRAVYLMVTECDLSMTAVAAIAGVTKQAVSKSMRDIEDEREDPKLDAMLVRVARHVAGRE